MFKWLRGGKKARELAEVRAGVERLQRALLPLHSALQGDLAARLRAAEGVWREARAAEERGDAQGEARALAGYGEVRAALVEVRREAFARAPEHGVTALLGRAELLLEELQDPRERATAWLDLCFARLQARDFAALERMLAATAEPEASVPLVQITYVAERELGARAWLGAARERAVATLHALAAGSPEGAEQLHELALAQADGGDRAGARATLARLEGEFRDQALVSLVAAEAAAGALEAARAALAEIEGREARALAGFRIAEALARRPGAEADARAAANALVGDARSRALIQVAAARARSGNLAHALALVEEIEPPWQGEAHLVLLEEELDRGDLAAAEGLLDSLGDDAHDVALARLGEAAAQCGEDERARASIGGLREPLARASALEHLAWAQLTRGNEDGARESFALALQLASETARRGDSARYPGRVGDAWLSLCVRIQAALGDPTSAAASVSLYAEPVARAAGWTNLGAACGRRRDFEALETVDDGLSSPADRVRLLCGFAASARAHEGASGVSPGG